MWVSNAPFTPSIDQKKTMTSALECTILSTITILVNEIRGLGHNIVLDRYIYIVDTIKICPGKSHN